MKIVRHIKHVVSTLLLLCSTFTATASIISGTHYTNEGKLVDLQGLEWLSLDHTANLSRNYIEGGFTDRYGETWGDGEWRYATRAETESLLGSLWGQRFSGWSADNADGANWFLNIFGGLAYDTWNGNVRTEASGSEANWTNHDYSYFNFGNDTECTHETARTCQGVVTYYDNYNATLTAYDVNQGNIDNAYYANSGALGNFKEDFGVNMGFDNYNDHVSKADFSNVRGSLLVRESVTNNVPEPQSTLMIILALILLSKTRLQSK